MNSPPAGNFDLCQEKVILVVGFFWGDRLKSGKNMISRRNKKNRSWFLNDLSYPDFTDFHTESNAH